MAQENKARIRYNRDEMASVLTDWLNTGPEAVASALDAYEKARAEGKDKPCQAKVYHGPGHQSSTFCQITGGNDNHDVIDGVLHHYADLPSSGYAEWADGDPYARDY